MTQIPPAYPESNPENVPAELERTRAELLATQRARLAIENQLIQSKAKEKELLTEIEQIRNALAEKQGKQGAGQSPEPGAGEIPDTGKEPLETELQEIRAQSALLSSENAALKKDL